MQSVKQPRQKRSHASFSKVLSTTVSLLSEKGAAGVTIAEVSERAGVSVGTIYGRVGSRSNLMRLVHEQELSRLQESLDARLANLQSEGRNSIAGIVEVYINEMVGNTPIIRALVELTTEIDALSDAGPASWRASRRSITAALLAAQDAGSNNEHWAEWVFEIMFATTIHRLEQPDTDAIAQDTFTKNLSSTVWLLMSAGRK